MLPGIIKYGRLPVYDKDPDPSSLNECYDAFFGISGIIGGALSIFIIQVAILMTLCILIRGVRISRIELFSLCSSFFVLVWHIYFRFCQPASFAWLMD
ncbi:MAG TPA: hypothetical protein VGD89_07870 [Flavipsychrobacter sp.]